MKLVYLLAGSISLFLGMVGVILPVLPTIPFLIFTGYAYSKSSDRFHHRFVNSRIYIKYLKDFMESKSMKKKHKWVLLISVDLILLMSFLSVPFLFAKVFIVIVFLYKHYYFYRYVKVI